MFDNLNYIVVTKKKSMGMLIIIKMALLSHNLWISYLKIALNYVNTVLFQKNVL